MPATLRSRHVGKPSPSRPIVTGRRDCITGEVPSGKAGMGYRMVAYEGLLARDFILILEQDDAVLRYQEEPAPFRWHDGVRWRRYTADFAVEIDDADANPEALTPPHSVLTEHLIDEPGQPTRQALDDVIQLFRDTLTPAS